MSLVNKLNKLFMCQLGMSGSLRTFFCMVYNFALLCNYNIEKKKYDIEQNTK